MAVPHQGLPGACTEWERLPGALSITSYPRKQTLSVSNAEVDLSRTLTLLRIYVQMDGPGKMRHPKDLFCSYPYRKKKKKQKKNPNTKTTNNKKPQTNKQTAKCSGKGSNSHNSISAKRLLERHIQANLLQTGSAKPSLLHSQSPKAPVRSGGEGRDLHACGSPKWYRDALFSCLCLNACIGKPDFYVKKKSQQALFYFPVLTITSAQKLIICF